MKKLLIIFVVVVLAICLGYLYQARDVQGVLDVDDTKKQVQEQDHRDKKKNKLNLSRSGFNDKNFPSKKKTSSKKQVVTKIGFGEAFLKGKLSDDILMSDIDKRKLFETAKKEFDMTVSCILKQSCLSDRQGRFYDQNADPVIYKLKNTLGMLGELSTDNQMFLESLSVSSLIKAIDIDNTSITILASNLILRKNVENYSQLIQKAKLFKGDSSKFFIKLISNESFLQKLKPRTRRELISHYLKSSDFNTFSSVVATLNEIEFSKDDAAKFITETCLRVGKGQSEVQKVIRYNIEKIARKFSLSAKCKI